MLPIVSSWKEADEVAEIEHGTKFEFLSPTDGPVVEEGMAENSLD